jgi:two-component system response regulator DevR
MLRPAIRHDRLERPHPRPLWEDFSMALRIFLVDDHEVVRRGVRDMLEAEDDFEVVGEAGGVEEALNRISATNPDMAVLDVRLPDGNGVELCRELRSRHPSLACLMLTSFDDDEALVEAIMAGAAGYVLKQVKGHDIIEAVRLVGSGRTLLDPAMTARVIERLRNGPSEDPKLARLSGQERRILELLADGKTNRQIAAEIFLSEKTVKNYVSNLLTKMGMSRRTEAAVYAARQAERHERRPD